MFPEREHIANLLAHLETHTGDDIMGVVVTWMDGTVLFTRPSADIDQDCLAAVTTTLLGLSRCIADELQLGGTNEVVIKSYRGVLMLFPISHQMLMAICVHKGANLGMLSLEAREVVARMRRLLF